MMPRMAVKEPAHPLEKRDLLHADPPDRARIDAVASKMVSEGRFGEAVDYIEITRNEKLLAQCESEAVARGVCWLLSQADRIRGTKSGPETWGRLAESARGAERWIDAVRALQMAGRAEEAEALRLEKCPTYDPFKPLGK
jgi:hypothetical protein